MRVPGNNLIANGASDLDALQAAHKLFLESPSIRAGGTAELDAHIFNGTGVVTIGGGEYYGPAIITIQMLRRTGSLLPVEVFVADQSEYEPELCEQYLPSLGATCLILTDFLSSTRGTEPSPASDSTLEVKHYQLKPLAILFSSYANVLYLDSDSMPLVDPADLFASTSYLSTGLVVWPDFWRATESPLFYRIAGLATFPRDLPPHSSETGQLLVNKHTHLRTLLLATYYNVYGPDYYYPLLSQGALGQGDKETFLAAATALGMPWHHVRTSPEAVSRYDQHKYKGSAILQHSPADLIDPSSRARPAFLHANTPKMNAGHLVDEGDLVDGRKHLRLWGTRKEQMDMFGEDLELVVWGLLTRTGCELQHVLREWMSRAKMCARLKTHFEKTFS